MLLLLRRSGPRRRMRGRSRESSPAPFLLSSFLAKEGADLTIFLDQISDRLQANVISTGLLGVLLLPILQRTAAMQAPVEGVNLKPHLTIVASDSTSTWPHHSLSLLPPFPLLLVWRVLTDPVQCITEPALPSITNPNPSRHSTTRQSLTGGIGTRRPSCSTCSSHGRSHSCPRPRRVV